ncbi:unnamed protein product [Microthlaspi erraticum]|uniref:F-box protein At3g26010-like beta-propeller domain-containing protein n=1 Tax=Microthlaspi erraticum TaxID=1685480 RepID=A0A6D2I4G1_9BRAS|nr:unnamed protein product [Microthlaspi erraticum]
MFRTHYLHGITESLGCHGCETWGLPKSLASYIMPLQWSLTLTRVEDSVVSSFKVVRICQNKDGETNVWRVCMSSSGTGKWAFKRLFFSRPVSLTGCHLCMNLNGMLYLYSIESGVLITHDFYGPGDDDQCLVIPLFVPVPYNSHASKERIN